MDNGKSENPNQDDTFTHVEVDRNHVRLEFKNPWDETYQHFANLFVARGHEEYDKVYERSPDGRNVNFHRRSKMVVIQFIAVLVQQCTSSSLSLSLSLMRCKERLSVCPYLSFFGTFHNAT